MRAHIIQPGETLLDIAYMYSVPIEKIQQENGIVSSNYIVHDEEIKIPDTRNLHDIYVDIYEHFKNYSTHGPNCVCVDQYVREVRMQLPRFPGLFNVGSNQTPIEKAYYSMDHVLRSAMQYR